MRSESEPNCMRPSMWSSYLVERMPFDMVKAFSEQGWQHCELSDEHGHDLLNMGDPAEVGERFRRFAEDHGLTFAQGHFYLATKGIRSSDLDGRRQGDIAPADDDEFAKAMDEMARWIELFDAVGVRAGVLHAGGGGLIRAGWSEEAAFERRCQALSRILEMTRGTDIIVCLENLVGRSGVRTVPEIIHLIAAVGAEDSVGICLDTGHAQIAGVDPAEFARQAGDRLKALHVADNLGERDDHMLPYGRGVVKWSEVMTALRDIGYTGLFNYEVPGENRCPFPVRMAKLRYAKGLAEWMIDQDGRSDP